MARRVYGYARVSSRDQNEDRQMISLREYPVEEQYIFLDKQSGKDFQRPAYQRMLRKLKAGDILVVKSIDRLGRNYQEILEQWRGIVKEKQADIVVLDMPLLDTRQKERDLTGTLIADIVLQLLSYVAEKERDSIRQRQAEGIAAAHARGVRFGRPQVTLPDNFAWIVQKWQRGELSAKDAAQQTGLNYQTFLRHAKKRAGVTESTDPRAPIEKLP